MRGQAGFFDIEERLKELSAKGDTLERLSGLVDFELFRPDLERAVPRADRLAVVLLRACADVQGARLHVRARDQSPS